MHKQAEVNLQFAVYMAGISYNLKAKPYMVQNNKNTQPNAIKQSLSKASHPLTAQTQSQSLELPPPLPLSISNNAFNLRLLRARLIVDCISYDKLLAVFNRPHRLLTTSVLSSSSLPSTLFHNRASLSRTNVPCYLPQVTLPLQLYSLTRFQ